MQRIAIGILVAVLTIGAQPAARWQAASIMVQFASTEECMRIEGEVNAAICCPLCVPPNVFCPRCPPPCPCPEPTLASCLQVIYEHGFHCDLDPPKGLIVDSPTFQQCMHGPGHRVISDCAGRHDFDEDGDVDLRDWVELTD